MLYSEAQKTTVALSVSLQNVIYKSLGFSAYPLLNVSDNDAAGQPVVEHFFCGFQLPGGSGERRETGETQLETRRRRFWGGRRRLGRHSLHNGNK